MKEIQLFLRTTAAASSIISMMNSEQHDRLRDEDVPIDVHSPGAHVVDHLDEVRSLTLNGNLIRMLTETERRNAHL